MMATQKDIYRSTNPRLNSMMHELWRHSICCAIGSKWLALKANYSALAQEAFLAGLLHDIGKLFLLKLMEELMRKGTPDADISPALISEVLEGMHTVHGPRIMQQWNLPDSYIVIARDHGSDNWDQGNPLLAIVRLVNQACRKAGVHSSPEPDLVLFATTEAQVLGLREITLAELEIVIEDACKQA